MIKESIEDYVTVKEAAKLMNVTPQAIRKALKEKRVTGRKVGKIWLIKKTEFVQTNRNGKNSN